LREMQEDTIAALATPFGESAVSVVRISGPAALDIAEKILRPRGRTAVKEWKSHSLYLAEVWDAEGKEKLDEALAAVMRAPRSYTGEDVVEIHGHGGRLVCQEVLNAVLDAGARLAAPGEFTRRAFLNGKMDLVQAEAVADLIRARSDAARRLALRQMEGRLSEKLERFKERLVGVAAAMEAAIDFPEEGLEIDEDWLSPLEEASFLLGRILEGARGGRTVREGIRVVIIGRPNVGKSSLWNALIGEDRAIVTDIPGTTRDVLEEEVTIRGVPLRLADTAGIREAVDLVERIGVEKTREMLRRGQVVVVVLDAAEGFQAEDRLIVELAEGLPRVIAVNKTDLTEQRITEEELKRVFPGEPLHWISVKEGWGIDEVKEAILQKALDGLGVEENEWLVSNARQERALRKVQECLDSAIAALRSQMPLECVQVDLREGLTALGEVTGEALDEQVIDRIFSDFCIGK